MQPVLCTRTKTPMWRGWPDYFPTLDDIAHHDHRVGHVPARLGLLVFDVDHGTTIDIDDFCQRYPPLLRVPSNQPGRAHLYYRYPHASRIRPGYFQGHGLKGEIRSHHSYAIMWDDTVVELRDALIDPDRASGRPPLHLIGATPPPRSVSADPPLPRNCDPIMALNDSSPGLLLWERLRHCAYYMKRGKDLADWHARVLSEAHRINDPVHPALSSRALQGTAQPVADWIWPAVYAKFRKSIKAG